VQALALTALDTAWLKWATGRPFPTHGGDPNSPERLQPGYAKEFGQESFSTRGYLAWPSGHTSTSVAVAAALTAYYPERIWIPLLGYPVGLLIGLGMMQGDHHWASDVVAGAMLGHAIGYSVGRSFRSYRSDGRPQSRLPWIQPLLGGRGVALGAQF
jgi:membrane-associated phospholipid phosphatase